jgi:hypothetical protein
MADECRGVLIGGRLRNPLDPVLRRKVVELVGGATRLDQVRRDERVVRRLDPLGLGVVGDDLALQSRGPLCNDDFVGRRDRYAPILAGKTHPPLEHGQAFPPRDGNALDGACGGRHCRIELVDPVQQVAELKLPEHLLEP